MITTGSIVCPRCAGSRIEPFFGIGIHRRDCEQCSGDGFITAEQYRWTIDGERMRHWRRYVVRRGLREEAERRGILPSDYYKMESGFIEPVFPVEMLPAS